MKIDAKGLHYKDLNEQIHMAVRNGEKEIIIDNVNGQRYIGDGLKGEVNITINGVPGNDLAAFMDGPTILVRDNGQDGIGNTMNAGKIVVFGDAGDIVGHSMRGGKIYIKGDVGYRIGIHMKSYKDLYPVVIIGGRARDFLGEYMAGGLIIVLGLNQEKSRPSTVYSSQKKIKNYELSTIDYGLVGNYVGTGMHGGKIYIRGEIEKYQLGKEVKRMELDEKGIQEIEEYLKEYCDDLSLNFQDILKEKFVKLVPHSTRPYDRVYAY